jgi:hypothetical protein
MPELPQHPDSTEPATGGPRRTLRTVVVVVVVILLVGTFVVLHLTGVLGAGQHS